MKIGLREEKFGLAVSLPALNAAAAMQTNSCFPK